MAVSCVAVMSVCVFVCVCVNGNAADGRPRRCRDLFAAMPLRMTMLRA